MAFPASGVRSIIWHGAFFIIFWRKETLVSAKDLKPEKRFLWRFFLNPATATKSLQSCPTLCDPIDGSPPGSPVPGILQARTLEWVAISFSNAWKWKVKVKSLSCVRLLATPWTAAHQAPPAMGFSRQEYWSGVPLPSPESEIGEWKSWLKTQHSKNKDHGIQSHHFMQKDGETMETVTDFVFLGSKITADGDCSHEIKVLILGRKAMTNLDSILKRRGITLLTKVHPVKDIVFPVVMYECERWRDGL